MGDASKPTRRQAQESVYEADRIDPARGPVRLGSGVAGLDEVLCGGLPARKAYLVRGGPGTGKTTLGLHFLTAGSAHGDKSLFISLSESEPQVRANAAVSGFDLSGVEFLDLSPPPEYFSRIESYDIFAPAEVEREPITRQIIERIETLRPDRVFVDALTQFRYLASDEQQFRRQVLSFMRFVVGQGCTMLLSSEASSQAPDEDLQFLADGVINFRLAHSGRELWISKLRGSDFRSGRHAMRLSGQGVQVFPRVIPVEHGREYPAELIGSGVTELDALLHGGLERGTITLVTGPSGAGKTTLGMQFMKQAAERGERSVIYTFEEGLDTLFRRCQNIGIPARGMVRRGQLSVVPVEGLRYSADEFAGMVREEVEQRGARIVMIDSTAGYKIVIRGHDLVASLHALSRYLKNMGVTVILANDVEMITGVFRITEIGVSYLADNIVFLRYLEVGSELRKAVGVLKKRSGDFEHSLRELRITTEGLQVGEPLRMLQGIVSGEPDVASPGDLRQ